MIKSRTPTGVIYLRLVILYPFSKGSSVCPYHFVNFLIIILRFRAFCDLIIIILRQDDQEFISCFIVSALQSSLGRVPALSVVTIGSYRKGITNQTCGFISCINRWKSLSPSQDFVDAPSVNSFKHQQMSFFMD